MKPSLASYQGATKLQTRYIPNGLEEADFIIIAEQ
jgi:hypothetical protein